MVLIPPLTPDQRRYHAAMRVLLEGTCGLNVKRLSEAIGVHRHTIVKFMRGGEIHPVLVDEIAWFVWRQMNAPVLLCDADRTGGPACRD